MDSIDMNGKLTARQHFFALLLVFVVCSLLSLAYGTFYYEAQAEYIERSKVDTMAKLEELESSEAKALSENDLEGLEAIRTERKNIEKWSRNAWINHLPSGLVYWWPWVLLTPAILVLCHRFQYKRKQFLLPTAVHLGAGLAFAAVKTIMGADGKPSTTPLEEISW